METLHLKQSDMRNFKIRMNGHERSIVRFIKRLPVSLPPFPEILDVGCGTGAVSFAFLERFPNAHIVATDINQKMLLAASKKAYKNRIPPERLEFGEADTNNPEEITFLDKEIPTREKPGSFHCVAMNAVREHIDLELALPVIFRLLKPGGYLVMINVNNNRCGKIYGILHKFSIISPEELLRMFKINGFENIETVTFRWSEFPANFIRKGVVARKRRA